MPFAKPRNLPNHEKKSRLELTQKFDDASQIIPALRAENSEDIKKVLTTLRNQLSVPLGTSISPQDDRLILVKQWMENSPGAEDLFAIWDKEFSGQSPLIALVLSLISIIITILSFHYTDFALAQPIMKTLLNPNRLRQLNSYIASSNNEVIIVTLKLFNVMSNFAVGRDKKSVLEGFGWEIKSLPKLLKMRRKAQSEGFSADPLLRPDIRTLYILLLLSFVDADSLPQTKTLFLEQHRLAFLAIFKDFVHDHYSLAKKVLEVCWAGIWLDAKVKRTLKVNLFNETTLGHLVKLYDRVQIEGEEDHIPANLVHHFLLAISTHPGTGICFKDRGWYHRELDQDDSQLKEQDDNRTTPKIYNKILANFIKTLKVNEDSRQQELVIKILTASPELVAGYWPAAALTLEPRLSSKWITNISVLGNIISLSLPTSSFYNPITELYQSTPPPLNTIIENIFPSVNTKNIFSKGLQSTSGLVQHCTAFALCKCLMKYQEVDAHFRKIAVILEENENEGQWYKRCREIEREVRRRVPEFQVVIGFSQQKLVIDSTSDVKAALLAESSQRILWLYQQSLPAVVTQNRFDIGKLLQIFSLGPPDSGGKGEDLGAPLRLRRLQELHVLRVLRESDQFVWTGKIASLTNSAFYILLVTYASSIVPAIRRAVSSLLQRILSQSILFQEDHHEPELWLTALPKLHKSASDGLPFYDRADGVISFVDDCVQRCLKTFYRYVEALHSLAGSSNQSEDILERLDMFPSPLIMTVIEQLDAKINSNILGSLDILNIVTFIRKLVFNLARKTSSLCLLRIYVHKLDDIITKYGQTQDGSNDFSATLQRELNILHATLEFTFSSPRTQSNSSNDDVEAYLKKVESMIPEDGQMRLEIALNIVNWLRKFTRPLSSLELHRLLVLVATLDTSALPLSVEYLLPGTDVLQVVFDAPDLSSHLPFEWLYLFATNEQLNQEKYQVILSKCTLIHASGLIDLTRIMYLIMHGIASSQLKDEGLLGHLSLIHHVLKSSSSLLSPTDLISLKEVIFIHPNVVRDIMTSPMSSSNIKGIRLLQSSINLFSEDDRKIVSSISNYWFDMLITGVSDLSNDLISTAGIWLKYLEQHQLLDLLDSLQLKAQKSPAFPVLKTMEIVLECISLRGIFEFQAELALIERLSQLLSLQPLLPDSAILVEVVAISIEASLPISLCGLSSDSNSFEFEKLVKHSEFRWSQRNRPVNIDLDFRSLLQQVSFSPSTVRIITALIYRESCPSQVFAEWIASEACFQRGIECLLPIFHAFLDMPSNSVSIISPDLWLPFIPRIVEVLADENYMPGLRRLAEMCLVEIICSSDSSVALGVLETLKSLPRNHLPVPLISTCISLATKVGLKATLCVSLVLDKGIQLLIDRFSENQVTPVTELVTEKLTQLIKASSLSNNHLAETLLSVIIQNRLTNFKAVGLAISCISTFQLKPVSVNRHLQSLIHHPHFFRICSSSDADHYEIRVILIEFLHCLFNLYPTNTCQVTHIEPLIKIYHGTLSSSDLRIMAIFQLFENHRKLSVAPLLTRWSSTPKSSSHGALDALQALDPVVILRTSLYFPRWRHLEDQSSMKVDEQEACFYDPVFIILLFSQMLSEQPPTSAFGWIELFRTNVVSLFIRALSSRDHHIRELALCQIAGLFKLLQTADLQERSQVIHILNLLKDSISSPDSTSELTSVYPGKIPTYTTLFLMHALRGIFHPSGFIYPLTARFLLQRPTLDLQDIPMLYGMLYSDSDENSKKERAWMIKFLADGMVGSDDWRVFKRRHTWDLLASLFQSSDDEAVRMGILEVLANLTCNAQATTSLVLKSGLLPWIEMQLLNNTKNAAGIEWIKIIENIVVIVDSSKIEMATNGEWRRIICRCLMYLLDENGCSSTTDNFLQAAPVILRLATLSGRKLVDLPSLLNHAVNCLEALEGRLQVNTSLPTTQNEVAPPHRSLSLQKKHSNILPSSESLRKSTKMLWQASMSLNEKCFAWEKLTPRILIWNAAYPGTEVFEWARKESILNLRASSLSS